MTFSLVCPLSLLSWIASAHRPHLQPRAVPPHLHPNVPDGIARSSSKGFASMTASIQEASRDTMKVTVTWKDAPARELGAYDWVGAFDRELMSEFHAPVKFQYVFFRDDKYPFQTYGSLNFTLKNLRSSYIFIYISGNQQYPEIIAQSNPITFDVVTHPMAVHVAISPSDPNKMLIMWNQKSPQNPSLKWGLHPSKLGNSVAARKDTYTRDDFCDRGVSPAGRQGWFEPGFFLTAEVPTSPGMTYFYTCGDEDGGWSSDIQNFTAPPAASDGPTRLIVLADLGNTPGDGSLQHSWDFHNHGEIPSRNTTRLAKHLLDKEHAHALVHVGDISYAVGYLSEWDEFMLQIEPVASRIPWMASIGNHEMGWSLSDPFNDTLATAMDSGGECGVAFLKRFPYAMQPLASDKATHLADPWYSFDVGSVHFTMLSSEHDFRSGSPQWQWMVADLQRVDRSSTPWVAVTSHRPMYIASSWSGDQAVADLLRQHVEPQLLEHGVDFFFAGHHHSYQRFCKLNNGTCVEKLNDNGIYHFVIGMAGYDHSKVAKSGFPNALFTDEMSWGATYWEFNQTVAAMRYIDGATDEVVDEFAFRKPAPQTEATVVI